MLHWIIDELWGDWSRAIVMYAAYKSRCAFPSGLPGIPGSVYQFSVLSLHARLMLALHTLFLFTNCYRCFQGVVTYVVG